MNPIVLFRECFDLRDPDVREEKHIAEKYLTLTTQRNNVPSNSLVIGRYACLPYYRELELDLECCNSKLINSYTQHRYIADIMNYAEDLAEFTPKTFTEWGHISSGDWVVKGRTNSRKFQWNTHMFASGREQLLQVVTRLLDDPLIGDQGLVVREYIPLKQVDIGFYCGRA